MATSIEEEVNYTSLIELFGTFFEKVTNSHPQKETLNRHLSDFKRMLYTNKSNLPSVETYLEDLKRKTHTSSHLTPKNDHSTLSDTKKNVPKPDVSRSTKRYKTFGPEATKTSTKSHKFETINVASFIKNRSLEHSNQKQSLLNKYSYIYEFELDSSNFYRLVAVGTIMHLICTSDSNARLVEIIEDVDSHKIALKNYYYSYTHDEYASVFCGYIEQILTMKKEGKSVQAILQLFQDMVKYDHLFNIALLCYLKGKLIHFVSEQLPKGTWSNQTAWDQLHSPDITEKILNNNPMVFESLLHILPFLLNLRIVTQITENGTLYERSYSKKSLGAMDSNPDQSSSDIPEQAIHLMVEKIFTTSNFYLLVPTESKPVATNVLTSQSGNRAIIEDIKQKYSTKSSKTMSVENKIMTEPPQSTKSSAVAGVNRRQIEAENFVLTDRGNLSPGKNPLNGIKSPRFFMTPSKLRGSDSITDQSKDAPHSEKKKSVTEYSEIVNGSLPYQLERSNGKENKITFEKPSPPQRKAPESKDRSQSKHVSENRMSLPTVTVTSQSMTSRGSDRAFLEHRIENSYSVKPSESEENFRQRQNSLTQFESPYDLYIKTKSQQSAFTARPPSDEKNSTASSKPGSFAYTGNPFNSTPYDNYVSSYNYPNQNGANSNRFLPTQASNYATESSESIQKTLLGTNISAASTSHTQTSVTTPSSDSSSLDIIKKFSKLPVDYSHSPHENYNFSVAAENDQALRERLKNFGTLAPKSNDSTPSNPFSQISSKNITAMGTIMQNSQDATSPYNYQHNKYNLDSKGLPSYGVQYSHSQETKTAIGASYQSAKISSPENFQPISTNGIGYNYKFTQNLTVQSSQSSRYSVSQGTVSVDSSFNNNSLY